QHFATFSAQNSFPLNNLQIRKLPDFMALMSNYPRNETLRNRDSNGAVLKRKAMPEKTNFAKRTHQAIEILWRRLPSLRSRESSPLSSPNRARQPVPIKSIPAKRTQQVTEIKGPQVDPRLKPRFPYIFSIGPSQFFHKLPVKQIPLS